MHPVCVGLILFLIRNVPTTVGLSWLVSLFVCLFVCLFVVCLFVCLFVCFFSPFVTYSFLICGCAVLACLIIIACFFPFNTALIVILFFISLVGLVVLLSNLIKNQYIMTTRGAMGLWTLVIIMCAAGVWIGITSNEQKYDVSAFVGYSTAWYDD